MNREILGGEHASINTGDLALHELAITDSPLTGEDLPSTDFLIAQAMLQQNTDDEETSGVIETLRARKDAAHRLMALLGRTSSHEGPVRANLLRLLGALQDPSAAEFLSRVASAPLPAGGSIHDQSDRASELRVRTIAIEALLQIAERHASVAECLLRIVAARPLRPVLVEALKAASELRLTSKVREVMGVDNRAAIDVRRASAAA